MNAHEFSIEAPPPEWAQDSAFKFKTEGNESELNAYVVTVLNKMMTSTPFIAESNVSVTSNTLTGYTSLNFNGIGYIGIADVVVSLVEENGHKRPVLMGELKTHMNTPEDVQQAFLHLFSYQLSRQRPTFYDEANSSSTLLGFVMDYSDGYINWTTVGKWTDERPVRCNRIERYKTTTAEERYSFLRHLLTLLSNEDRRLQYVSGQPLFHFPAFGSPVRGLCYLRQLRGAEIQTHYTTFCTENCEFYYGSESSIRSLPSDTKLFLKVYNEILSAGVDRFDDLPQLLKQADAPECLTHHYIALYRVTRNYHPFTFSLSHYIGDDDCLSQRMRDWWRANPKEARARFYDEVYKVATDALVLGFFHWDIRPQNIMWSDSPSSKNRFIIVDWESGIRCNFPNVKQYIWLKEFENQNEARQQMRKCLPESSHPSMSMRAALVVCESLMRCLERFDGKAFSSMAFAERLEQRKAQLESCRTLRDLLKILDILMSEFLKPSEVRLAPVRRSSLSYCTINQFVHRLLYNIFVFASQNALPQASSAEAAPQPMAPSADC